MKKRKGLLCVFMLFLVALCACSANSDIYLEEQEVGTEELTENMTVSTQETENSNAIKMCYVYICGAVLRPGVYALQEGSRIYEAVEMAGGLLPEADVTSVNQAETVVDGQMIQVYTQEESQKTVLEENDGRIDINRADKNALMTLPGIGEAKAEAILAYREANGRFVNVDELKNISGIKDGIFDQIKEQIKVSN